MIGDNINILPASTPPALSAGKSDNDVATWSTENTKTGAENRFFFVMSVIFLVNYFFCFFAYLAVVFGRLDADGLGDRRTGAGRGFGR